MTDQEAAHVLMSMCFRVLPCAYCGVDMDSSDPSRRPTRDHIWPKGMRSIEQGRTGTVWCCHGCNIKKGNMTPSEWLAVIG